MEITMSAIKADVGSIAGHTKPSKQMIQRAEELIKKAIKDKLIIDGTVTHTGDDIALIMSHTHGNDSNDIHMFAWDCFLECAAIARTQGCYGAGQDLLATAPSGNVRGAGPGVAEITFSLLPEHRKAEAFTIITADKCSPGAFNLPLLLAFADPMYCAGLMLPQLIKGFTFTLVDMNHKGPDLLSLELSAPEDLYKLAILLRDNERFGIKSIHSRTYNEQAVSASTDRLHSIAGTYTGKDDPIAIVRTQGIFPACEELLYPFTKTAYVAGNARGSHNMPLMPVAINSAVTSFYCIPIVSCIGFSLAPNGTFSDQYVDFFDSDAWNVVRTQAQEKALAIRSQGWSGAAMLPYSELEYSGYRAVIKELENQFSSSIPNKGK